MFNWFKKKVLEPLPDKDPKDYTLTSNSTQWESEYYCRTCKKVITHKEFMASICNGCGSYYGALWLKRAKRQIVQNGKWVFQYRCPSLLGNETMEIVDKEYGY